MLILVDASLGRAEALGDLIRSRGCDVALWSPDQPLPDNPRIAILNGLERVVECFDLPCDILAVVEPHELALFSECPREVRDFVMADADDAELIARLGLLRNEPSLTERTHRHLLSLAADQASDIIEITDLDGRVAYANVARKAVSGGAQAVVGTWGLGEGDTPIDRERRRTLAGGTEWNGSLTGRGADGSHVLLETIMAPIVDAKGGIEHVVAIKRDITARRAAEAAMAEAHLELARARDAAIAAAKSKTDFLANMSHELRTPLNAIIGYSEMVAEDLTDAAMIEDMGRIQGAATSLLGLIADVLDFNKLDGGRVEVDAEEIALVPILNEVAQRHEQRATAKNNTLTVTDGAPTRVVSDEARVRQILDHLVSNACKFTEGGAITLEAKPQAQKGVAGALITVRDTGVGIPEEHRTQLFVPFAQGDTSSTRRYGGAGLGLAIVKRLSELLGGTIDYETAVGSGTTFKLWLPS